MRSLSFLVPKALLIAAVLAHEANATIIEIDTAQWNGEIVLGWTSYHDGREQPYPSGTTSTKTFAQNVLSPSLSTYLVEHDATNILYGGAGLMMQNDIDFREFSFSMWSWHDSDLAPGARPLPAGAPIGYVSTGLEIVFNVYGSGAKLHFSADPFGYGQIVDLDDKISTAFSDQSEFSLLDGHRYRLITGISKNTVDTNLFVGATLSGATAKVPEPGTLALLGTALLAGFALRRFGYVRATV